MEAPAPARHLFVVFGATGDLFQRKLLPALYGLHRHGKLPEGTVILGTARRPLTDAQFRALALQALRADKADTEEKVRAFCRTSLFYHPMDDTNPQGFRRLSERVEQIESKLRLGGNRIFYLALPEEAVAPTIQGIGRSGLNKSRGWTRVVIEKPFGRDLASARALNWLVLRYFRESQVFRIDHYLGKETVQNLLVFRFANMFIESMWNRERIERVEITVAEALGLEGRGGYYEHMGALRDMVQSHVTQLLTLVAMEPPATKDEDSIRNEKVKVLRSIVRIGRGDVVRGQYTGATVDGRPIPGYREEPGVSPTSQTETYVALRLKIANWRWQDVPFFIRTGKRLPAKSSRVVLTFKAPPVSFFQQEEKYEANPDQLTILLQPDEGFEVSFEVKVPGREVRVQTHRMKFHYADVFGVLPDGYETLLIDVMIGDTTLFVRADEVEESWRLYAPVLENPPPLAFYPADTWGPREARTLVEPGGHRWTPA